MDRFVVRVSRVVTSLVLVAGSGRALGQTNLIQNGGFEVPVVSGAWVQRLPGTSFGGWNVDAMGQGVVHVASFGRPLAIEGLQSVELNFYVTGAVNQTIPTEAGKAYVVSFLMAGQIDRGPDVREVRVDFNTTPIGTVSWSRSATGGQWVVRHVYAMASSAATAVHFVGVTPSNVDGGPYIDDIRVVECIDIREQPVGAELCSTGAAHFSVGVLCAGSVSHQWQFKSDGSDVWENLEEGGNTTSGGLVLNVTAAHSASIVVSPGVGVWPSGAIGRVRCVATSDCGSATSAEATISVCGADFNCDGFANGNDYDEFALLFEAGDPGADITGDSFVNGDDYDAFASSFEAGC